MVSQYRKTHFFCEKNHVFSGTRDFSKSIWPVLTFTAKKTGGGMPDLELQSELRRGRWFFGTWGWKYVEIGQLDFFRSEHPWPAVLDPVFLAGKSANPAFEGIWKGSKTVKNRGFWSSNAFYRFSFASSSVYNSTLRSLTPVRWFHDIQKKLTFLFCKNHGFFYGTRYFSKFMAYIDVYRRLQPKTVVCEISNYRANCDVGVDFLERGGANTSK